jgi:hypothetical protein
MTQMTQMTLHEILPLHVVERILCQLDTKSAFRFLATSKAGLTPALNAIAHAKAKKVIKDILGAILKTFQMCEAIFWNEAQMHFVMRKLLKRLLSIYDEHNEKAAKCHAMTGKEQRMYRGCHETISSICEQSQTGWDDVEMAWRNYIQGKPIPLAIYQHTVRYFENLGTLYMGTSRKWKASLKLTDNVCMDICIGFNSNGGEGCDGGEGQTMVEIKNITSFMLSDEKLSEAIDVIYQTIGTHGAFMKRTLHNIAPSIVYAPHFEQPLTRDMLELCDYMNSCFAQSIHGTIESSTFW